MNCRFTLLLNVVIYLFNFPNFVIWYLLMGYVGSHPSRKCIWTGGIAFDTCSISIRCKKCAKRFLFRQIQHIPDFDILAKRFHHSFNINCSSQVSQRVFNLLAVYILLKFCDLVGIKWWSTSGRNALPNLSCVSLSTGIADLDFYDLTIFATG